MLAERSDRIGNGSWKTGVSDVLAGAGWPMAAFPSE